LVYERSKRTLARMANKEDGCKGTFFEGRYKSIALLDEQSLLAACVYIDLNPVAAGIAETPERGPYTSLKQRIEYVTETDRRSDLAAALEGSIPGRAATSGLEDGLWLIPIEDRRGMDSTREGMLEGFTLGNYLLLIEYTGHLKRPGKTSLNPDLESVFERLGITPGDWSDQQSKLSAPELTGRFLSSSRQRLRDAASKLGVHHCVNLNGCFAA
jgi:hypothetical protein